MKRGDFVLKTDGLQVKIGPIDSIDQWAALSGEDLGDAAADPRTEVLLAGIDSDKRGAGVIHYYLSTS